MNYKTNIQCFSVKDIMDLVGAPDLFLALKRDIDPTCLSLDCWKVRLI